VKAAAGFRDVYDGELSLFTRERVKIGSTVLVPIGRSAEK
jgi:hypothetical protein